MDVRPSALMEIEKLLTQVLVVALTFFAASLTRRGIYRHDMEAVQGGIMLALIWAMCIALARWRQGREAWWLLISAPIVLAMPAMKLVEWLLS